MGDFEDHYGAGADADNIISNNNVGYARATWVQKARWFGEPSQDKLDKAIARDEFEAWSKAMTAKGYTRGPQFETHDKLKEWDAANKRPHVRREGYGGWPSGNISVKKRHYLEQAGNKSGGLVADL